MSNSILTPKDRQKFREEKEIFPNAEFKFKTPSGEIYRLTEIKPGEFVWRKMKSNIRNYTESQAIKSGMSRAKDYGGTTTHCPECGCPWYGNINMCGEGHRVCCDCYQDWWVNVKYDNQAQLRELPK
jgi:hypothetical protein